VSGVDFASGTGGVVNNGAWTSTPHENAKRLANFNMIMDAFKDADMAECTNTGASAVIEPVDDSTESPQEESESEADPVPAVSSPTCPPAGWEKCGGLDNWPPGIEGYCCSEHGYLGDTADHCKAPGVDATAECCTKTDSGSLSCAVPEGFCEDPPEVCTGDAGIDAILKKSDIGCKMGLSKSNEVYTWEGFCTAVREFNAIGDRKLYLGDG